MLTLPCDLLSRLADHREFAMTHQEMATILEPTLYIGRCPEQVDAFLEKLKPLLADVSMEAAEINV